MKRVICSAVSMQQSQVVDFSKENSLACDENVTRKCQYSGGECWAKATRWTQIVLHT